MASTWDNEPSNIGALVLSDDERPLEGGVPLAYVAPTPYGWWIGVTHDLIASIYESPEDAQKDCERLVGNERASDKSSSLAVTRI